MRMRRFGLGALGLIALVGIGAWSSVQADRSHPDVPSITDAAASGHRLWIFVFDVSSMNAVDVLRARQIATRFINGNVSQDDLLSIVSIGTTLKLLQNFTSNPNLARSAVNKVLAPPSPDAEGAPEVDERDFFNNDLRFRGLRAVCQGLEDVTQRKAILFFTAYKDRPGADNQAELKSTTATCSKARTSINPIPVDQVVSGR